MQFSSNESLSINLLILNIHFILVTKSSMGFSKIIISSDDMENNNNQNFLNHKKLNSG